MICMLTQMDICSNLNKVECKFLRQGLPKTTTNCSNLNKVECK